MIEQNISSGSYKTLESFDVDMNRVFNNAIKYYDRSSEIGIAAAKLKKVYIETKYKTLPKFEDILGIKIKTNKSKKAKGNIFVICFF